MEEYWEKELRIKSGQINLDVEQTLPSHQASRPADNTILKYQSKYDIKGTVSVNSSEPPCPIHNNTPLKALSDQYSRMNYILMFTTDFNCGFSTK